MQWSALWSFPIGARQEENHFKEQKICYYQVPVMSQSLQINTELRLLILAAKEKGKMWFSQGWLQTQMLFWLWTDRDLTSGFLC